MCCNYIPSLFAGTKCFFPSTSHTPFFSLSLAQGLQGLQMQLHLPLLDLQDHRAQVRPRLFHHPQVRHLPEPRQDPQDPRDLCPDPLLGQKLRHLRWELDHQFHPRRFVVVSSSIYFFFPIHFLSHTVLPYQLGFMKCVLRFDLCSLFFEKKILFSYDFSSILFILQCFVVV